MRGVDVSRVAIAISKHVWPRTLLKSCFFPTLRKSNECQRRSLHDGVAPQPRRA
jgi:hypothetical protein